MPPNVDPISLSAIVAARQVDAEYFSEATTTRRIRQSYRSIFDVLDRLMGDAGRTAGGKWTYALRVPARYEYRRECWPHQYVIFVDVHRDRRSVGSLKLKLSDEYDSVVLGMRSVPDLRTSAKNVDVKFVNALTVAIADMIPIDA